MNKDGNIVVLSIFEDMDSESIAHDVEYGAFSEYMANLIEQTGLSAAFLKALE